MITPLLLLMTAGLLRGGPVSPIEEGDRADAAFKAKDHAAYESALRNLVTLYPGNPALHSGLAWALAQRGDTAGAAAAYAKAIALDPGLRPPKGSSAPLIASDVRAASNPELVVQSGQAQGIGTITVSADGRFLATSGATVDVWDLATSKQLWALGGSSAGYPAAAISPDGAMVAAGGASAAGTGEVIVWSTSNGAELMRVPAGKYPAQSIAWSRDGKKIAAGGAFSGITVVDVASRAAAATFPGKGDVKQMTFDPSGRAVLLSSYKGIAVHDLSAPAQPSAVISTESEWSTAAVFSPAGDRLVAAGDAKALQVLEWPSRRVVARFERSHGAQRCVAVSPDGSKIAVASPYGAEILDLEKGTPIARIAAGDGPVAFVPGTALVAGVRGRDVILFDAATGAEAASLASRAHPVAPIAFSPDGTMLAAGGRDGTVDLWDLARAKRVRTFHATDVEVRSLVFTADGKAVVSAQRSYRPEVKAVVWRLPVEGGEPVPVEGPGREASELAMSPDGKRILAAEHQGRVFVLDATTLKVQCAAEFKGEQAARAVSPVSTSFIGDGARFLAAAQDKFAAVFDTATCKQLKESRFYQSRVAGSALGPVLSAEQQWLSVIDLDTALAAKKVTFTSFVGAVALSEDGRFAAVSFGSEIQIRDPATLDLRFQLQTAHRGRVVGLAFSPDGRFLASSSDDGTIKLWELAFGAPLVSLVAIDQEDGLAATPEGWYTASKGAFRGVAFRYQGRAFPFEQFDLKLNRPDLVLRRIGLASGELTDAFERAYRRRLAAARMTEESLAIDFALPVVKLGALPLSSKSRKLELEVSASDASHPLERLVVFDNDVPIAEVDLREAASRTASRKIAVELGAGRNKLQVSALNARGVESLKATREVVYDGPSEKPRLFVVSVGVSKYADAEKSLQYAAKDAGDLAKWFAGRKARFGDVQVTKLVDKDATREKVLAARAQLEKTRVDDVAVVFVAGHGLLDEKLDYYFAPHDTDFAAPSSRGITHAELEGLLDGIPARRRVLLMDTCHSGIVGDAPVAPPIARAEGKVRAIATRGVKALAPAAGASPEGGSRAEDSLALVQELFANLERGSGAVVIAAAGGAEYALESPKWKNGVFTYAVLDGLTTKKADKNADATILVSELRDWVARKVPELTSGQQRPTARRENLELDFAIE